MITSVNGQTYYAESVGLSESISIEYFAPMGTKNYSAFPTSKPEGSIDITFYITTGDELAAIESGYAETGFSDIQIGPFSTDQALLNSFSVNSDASNIIRGSLSYSYYGQIQSGEVPPESGATIVPAHGAASSGSLEDFGASKIISFDYSFSQSFDVKYSLESTSPSKITMTDATRSLSMDNLLSDVDYEKTNLTGASGLCDDDNGEGFVKRSGYIELNNLCQEYVGRLDITGYLESRSFSVEPGGEVMESLQIGEKYVKNTGCGTTTTFTTTTTTTAAPGTGEFFALSCNDLMEYVCGAEGAQDGNPVNWNGNGGDGGSEGVVVAGNVFLLNVITDGGCTIVAANNCEEIDDFETIVGNQNLSGIN